ncbi:25.9 kDa protein [Cordyline virus 2]|uniref:25.9 kDa protein n=1 Tax=Cordyline virus 2 TaxID=1177751 RepID=L7P046_9CLOS|nr:25.9 kDa protein [Cordyline virus 2]AFJ05053.1 25.9 kDa protein [Cordyline virus 2]
MEDNSVVQTCDGFDTSDLEDDRVRNKLFSDMMDEVDQIKSEICSSTTANSHKLKSMLKTLSLIHHFLKKNENLRVTYIDKRAKELIERFIVLDERFILNNEHVVTTTVKLADVLPMVLELKGLCSLKIDFSLRVVLTKSDCEDILQNIPRRTTKEGILEIVKQKIFEKYGVSNLLLINIDIRRDTLTYLKSLAKGNSYFSLIRQKSIDFELNKNLIMSFEKVF